MVPLIGALVLGGCNHGYDAIQAKDYRTPVETVVAALNDEGTSLRPPLRSFEASHDLDGDGIGEALVYLRGPDLCGSGGCSLYLLRWDDVRWKIFHRTSVSQLPIYALDRGADGWTALGVTAAGGGMPMQLMRLDHGPSGYPDNPTAEPATPFTGEPAQLLIDEGEGERLP